MDKKKEYEIKINDRVISDYEIMNILTALEFYKFRLEDEKKELVNNENELDEYDNLLIKKLPDEIINGNDLRKIKSEKFILTVDNIEIVNNLINELRLILNIIVNNLKRE